MRLVHTAAAGVSGAACLVGVVSAEVRMFDNSTGTFVWIANADFLTPGGPFDPTRGVSEQASVVLGRSLFQGVVTFGGSQSPQASGFVMGASIRVSRSSTPIVVTNSSGNQSFFFPATTFAVGQQIGAAENYQGAVDTALFYPGGGAFNAPFLGPHPHIGFRVNIDGQSHFGWIELNFQAGPTVDGLIVPMYQPIRWAYETQPNTPITVPGAPAAAILLLGAATFSIRRRRS